MVSALGRVPWQAMWIALAVIWGSSFLLMKLGVDRLVMVGPNRMASPEHAAESKRLLAEVVIPELKRLG